MTSSCPTNNANENQENCTQKEKVHTQIAAIIIGCISGVVCGMLFSWPSPSIPAILSDTEHYSIDLQQASYFSVIPPVGQVCSSLLFAKLNDFIGRKRTLMLIAIPQLTSWVLIATTTNLKWLYVSRFITGIGDACLFSTLPIYVGEIASPRVRGTWGNGMTFSIYLGQLLVNVIGSWLSVQYCARICLVLPIAFICLFPFVPESPYFYLMKGRKEDAEAALIRLRGHKGVHDELKRLEMDVDRQMSEIGTWKSLFTIASNRKAVYAGIFLRASQQLGGIATFTVYTQYIFLQAGGNMSAKTSTILFLLLCMSLNLVASMTLDKLGRQRSYMVSCLACGIILLVQAIFYFTQQSFPDYWMLPYLKWVPVAGMLSYVLFYSFGLGIVPTLMLGELFSTSIKGKGLCLLNIIFAILISSITKLFHLLETSIGLFAPFMLFALSCLLSSILSLHFVPETKGKTLEEIQQSLKFAKQTNEFIKVQPEIVITHM